MDAGSPAFDGNDARFHQQLLDPAAINVRQPYGPATIYTLRVVGWLLVYQRLYANATLQQAMGELVSPRRSVAPESTDRGRHPVVEHRRLQPGSRTWLDEAVADGVADAVFDSLMEAPPSCPVGRGGGCSSWTARRPNCRPATVPCACGVHKPASNQHGSAIWPIMHWAVAHELSSGCAVRPETGAMYGPTAVSEGAALAGRLTPANSARSGANGRPELRRVRLLLPGRGGGARCRHAADGSLLQIDGSPGRGSRWTRTVGTAVDAHPRAERRKHPTWPADVSVSVTFYTSRTVVSPDG